MNMDEKIKKFEQSCEKLAKCDAEKLDNKLNNEIYQKQQDLIEISSRCEKLQGEKNLISERSKYDSNDVKLHDNILSLKEKLLDVDKEKYLIRITHDRLNLS